MPIPGRRALVNETVQLRRSPARPAGSRSIETM